MGLQLMDWLNNAWVVGIGGGILSGLLVTLITRYLFQKRDNREYAQKVASANREVLYAIRPGISEGAIPSVSVLRSLIAATARRYVVDEKDVYGPSIIAEELIKEVMDSSFISSKAKTDFCVGIATIKEEDSRPQVVEMAKASASISDYRSRMVTVMSAMLGVVTTVTTVFISFSAKTNSELSETAFLLPLMAALFAVMTTFVLFVLRRDRDGRLRTALKSERDERRKLN
jgi:hypothetical protein